MEERHLRGDRRVRRILGGLAGVFLLVCLALAALTARETENRMRGDLLQQVLWLAAAVDPDQVKELHFSPADRHNPVFQRMRAQMTLFRPCNAHGDALHHGSASPYLSIYTMVLREGRILFGPENIDEGAPQASPPGTVYREPPEELLRVFDSAQAQVVGPFSDEYGTFVTAAAPSATP